MSNLKHYEIWFLTGSQHLYGPETLEQVATHSREIVATLNDVLPTKIVFKPVLTTPEEILQICYEANATPACAGVITWMHTFSPAKNWILGMKALVKPFVHLHTQYNQNIPWDSIDMDFMNLNQAAHGDREFGFMMSRMRLNRKVVVGHWQDPEVQERLNVWSRVACAWADAQNARIARFGDNMRSVAVTDGDKVEAQMRLGYQVYGFGVGDLVERVKAVTDGELSAMLDDYEAQYTIAGDLRHGGARRNSVVEAAKIEIGLRNFLQDGNFKAFTTTFEDLHGLQQLPGLAVQRLMEEGYGFGAEGDWKTAALLRAMKVMATGLTGGGTSFMEDYTYHLDPSGQKVLGAHMLEICPTIADGKPKLEVHPLGIGGKADPARLVFDVPAGVAINASLIDMGNRFRLIVNDVDVLPSQPMPKLPVARALWVPQPNLKVGAAAWIYAGGAHHTGFSQSLTAEYMADFAEMAGIEYLRIDHSTNLHDFKNELRWNEMYYMLAKGI